MLSCPMPAGDIAAGARCCRLASTHEPVSRVRRYPTDVTDAQWAVLDPLLPDPAWLAGRGGRREKHCRRIIVDAILYVVDNGITWRALPADFPAWPTVYKRFSAWEKTGTTQRLLDRLRDRARLSARRTAAPSAAIIDSQSVRAAETVSRATRGYDAGKKVQGRKRHIVVDTAGFLLTVLVTPASTQDRIAARYLLRRLCHTVGSRLRPIWADGGYTGTLLAWARSNCCLPRTSSPSWTIWTDVVSDTEVYHHRLYLSGAEVSETEDAQWSRTQENRWGMTFAALSPIDGSTVLEVWLTDDRPRGSTRTRRHARITWQGDALVSTSQRAEQPASHLPAVIWRGKRSNCPAQMPLEASEAEEDGKHLTALKLILGAEQYATFRALASTAADAEDFSSKVMREPGRETLSLNPPM